MKNNPAIITIKDFVFYVIYTRTGGYGVHTLKQLQKHAKNDLIGKTIKCGKLKRTEWCCLSESEEGLAHVKYTGIFTIDGIKEVIESSCALEADDTMGSITELGWLPAISLSTESGYYFYPERLKYSKEDLKRRFKSRYQEGIYQLQGLSEVNIYVSPLVLPNRMDEALYAAFGDYDKAPSSAKRAAERIYNRVNDLCKDLEDYIKSLADYNHKFTLMPKNFTIDCRQLEFDFAP